MTTIALTMTRSVRVRNAALTNAVLVVLGSLMIAALTQVRVVLPFTPVPITGQTLGVLLIGAVLGSRRGAAAVGLYIVEGLAGLPFFSGGGAGLAYLLGPTGGYLAGFIGSAYLVGWLAERGLDRRMWTALPAFFAGEIAILACGVVWLARYVGTANALSAGFYPFIVGDIIKIALAAVLLPSAWALVRRYDRE